MPRQRITITAEVPEDMGDPSDRTGVTNAAFGELMDALINLGLTDIDIRRG